MYNFFVNNKITWLIFSINSSQYAISSSSVQEIATDCKIFPLPFVPDFVAGLINCHGEPYTVIDPAIMIQEKPQETSLFLILNNTNKDCLQITSVSKFVEKSNEEIVALEKSTENALFLGTLIVDNKNIIVLDTVAIIRRVKVHLENS